MIKRSKNWTPEAAARYREERAAIDADLITIEELSERLGIAIRTIRYWDKKGLLPPRTRSGRHLKYSRKALSEWEATGKLGKAQKC